MHSVAAPNGPLAMPSY
uniref:Uncharacterized protein n=1 Tax=Arundo donax TaxID=35708 RepID=A0A0A9BL00_ARUDO